MSLKKYNELTKEEQEKVKVMYSDLTTVEQYLYNFDKDKYRGRQSVPVAGIIYSEFIVPDKTQEYGIVYPEDDKPEDKPRAKRITKKK